MSPRDIIFFQERRDNFKRVSQRYSDRSKLISVLRASLFILFLVIIIILANHSVPVLVVAAIVLFFGLFGALLNYHARTRYQEQHNLILADINQSEISRIGGIQDHLDPGLEFADPHHPYQADLDIFGKHSLFQLVNRTTTAAGRKKIATWLSGPVSDGVIIARQKAVRELSGKIDLIQEFQAVGMHDPIKARVSSFLSWLDSNNLLLDNSFYRVASFLFPAIAVSLFVLYFLWSIQFAWFLLALVVNALLLYSSWKKISEIHKQTSDSIHALRSFEARIGLLEENEFQSGLLQEVQSRFILEGQRASKTIGKLKVIFLNFENRPNFFYQLLNAAFLIDFHFCFAAERWKSRQPKQVSQWIDAVSEAEVLGSLAGYAHANPQYVFPEISVTDYHFDSEELGHPLIPYEKRISNDFALKGSGAVAMITGSNMAGKSTFLRTIGINSVLAFAGAPVCAGRLEISPMLVFTSMRTQDVLEENISSFYAELTRIDQLLKLIPTNDRVFFLLDEILKGTNSKDRHLGAVSLVKQLSDGHVSGLISTHDLELARETMKFSKIANYSFESFVRDDEILFDYKLRNGICETFNASMLMEKMGIRLVRSDKDGNG